MTKVIVSNQFCLKTNLLNFLLVKNLPNVEMINTLVKEFPHYFQSSYNENCLQALEIIPKNAVFYFKFNPHNLTPEEIIGRKIRKYFDNFRKPRTQSSSQLNDNKKIVVQKEPNNVKTENDKALGSNGNLDLMENNTVDSCEELQHVPTLQESVKPETILKQIQLIEDFRTGNYLLLRNSNKSNSWSNFSQN